LRGIHTPPNSFNKLVDAINWVATPMRFHPLIDV
jgi:hypothetical protein